MSARPQSPRRHERLHTSLQLVYSVPASSLYIYLYQLSACIVFDVPLVHIVYIFLFYLFIYIFIFNDEQRDC